MRVNTYQLPSKAAQTFAVILAGRTNLPISSGFPSGRSRPYVEEISMLRFIQSLLRDERGVSALEYSVLAGIVVVAVAAAGASFCGTEGVPHLVQNIITNGTSVPNNRHLPLPPDGVPAAGEARAG